VGFQYGPGGFAMPAGIYQRGSSLAERFWSQVSKTNGCWTWQGAKSGNGYGTFKIGQVTVSVHRYAYEQVVGLIPVGLEIDHLCRNLICVRPDHMEAVTHRENVQRGLAGKINNHESRKTHCSRGHPYDLFNTYMNPKGERECRPCRGIRKRLHLIR